MGTVTTVHNAHWENRRRRRRRRYGRGSLCGAKEVIIIDGADVPTCVCTFIYLFLYNIYIHVHKYNMFLLCTAIGRGPPYTQYTP